MISLAIGNALALAGWELDALLTSVVADNLAKLSTMETENYLVKD